MDGTRGAGTLLLRGGRVVDPPSGADEITDVRVRGGAVEQVGALDPLPGEQVVDVTGLVVGPGFVDLHSHGTSLAAHRLQALDGVTTVLELEAGAGDVEQACSRLAEEGRPLNFGFSASWALARAAAMDVVPDHGSSDSLDIVGIPAWQRSATRGEVGETVRALERQLQAGALGVGVLLGYAPRSDPAEFRAVVKQLARVGAPAFVHVRPVRETDPAVPVDGPTELGRLSAEYGARLHLCHLNSTCLHHVDRVVGVLDRYRAQGGLITTEAYPFGAGSTAIGAWQLHPDRIHLRGITPQHIMMVSTGEWVRDARRLAQLRAETPEAMAVIHYLDEDSPRDMAVLTTSLSLSGTAVASDAMDVTFPDGATDTGQWPLPPGGMTHPRTAATFSRALQLMVLQRRQWSWPEAFARCSTVPADIVAAWAPAARRKGRLASGSDADIVIIDPATLRPRATYDEPSVPSDGVVHLLVGGEFVVRDRALVPDALPGRALLGAP